MHPNARKSSGTSRGRARSANAHRFPATRMLAVADNVRKTNQKHGKVVFYGMQQHLCGENRLGLRKDTLSSLSSGNRSFDAVKCRKS